MKICSNILLEVNNAEKFHLLGDNFLLLTTEGIDKNIDTELCKNLQADISIKIKSYDIKENGLEDINVLINLIRMQ